MHRGLDEHQMKRRSFAFVLAYIKCFRTYSVYLSLRLPAQILYAGIHFCPLAARRSCFGYSLSHLRTAAACLSRCIRHRRRSKAKPLRGRRGRLSRKPQSFQRCVPQLSPPTAGCPHPSRCGAAPHRATFPKGKASRSVLLGKHRGAEIRAPSHTVSTEKSGTPMRAAFSSLYLSSSHSLICFASSYITQ